MRKGDLSDTIVAISTPIGEGGIGIVRVSGAKALKIANEIFVSKDGNKASAFKTYTTHYGHAVDKEPGPKGQGARARIIDEVILTVMKAPRSYTKEDVVEINCHGGIQAAKMVLDLAVKRGARVAEPGEFTKRAFLNGRIDLAQAEAVLDTIRAKTEASLKVAMSQLEGGLSKDINDIRERVIDITSQVEAAIDFPDEELDTMRDGAIVKEVAETSRLLDELVKSYTEGIILREGVLAIICGKPNVGKSSLMNLLLKRDRVIVSPIPGTTRDAVEEMITLRGIPIRLVDTAGIGKADDMIARQALRKSKTYLKLADIAIFILDASTRISKADLDIIKFIGPKKKLVVVNKIDLATKIDMDAVRRFFREDKIVKVSVKKRTGITILERSIADIIWKGELSQGESAVVANARHKDLLDKARANMISVKEALESDWAPELIAVDLKEAVFNLGLVVGKSVSEDILDRIFGQFCIGK